MSGPGCEGTTVRVFIARTDAALERAEEALRERGVSYEIALEGVPEDDEGSNVCYQRLVVRVGIHEERRAREAFLRAGVA